MNLADVVAVIMFLGVVLYAVFGGADFGSGVWDLTAGNAEKGGRLRRVIDHALGPVWEANHVWLIFVLVFLWTGFPSPFAAIMRTLAIPFWFAGLGIVLRGAGFAFRKFAPDVGFAKAAGVVFAASSLITPFFLGAIAGAVASGRVPATGTGDIWSSWLNPTSILGGVLAVLTCTFLAGVFLAADAQGLAQHDLAETLGRRSLYVGALTGAVAIVGIIPLSTDAETLFDGLRTHAFVFIAASAINGMMTLRLLLRGMPRVARLTAAVAVASVVAGWGVGQYPWVLVDQIKIDQAAASTPVLTGLVVAFGFAGVLVVPPLVYLYVLADRNQVGNE